MYPKQYNNNIRLRRTAIGDERRRNMSKIILEKGTPFPKPIEYSDIDEAMFEWVDSTFPLVFDGKKIPTYKLFSTQRISEYSQSWKELDENGNIIMNFKTITRETNPQKGENQGQTFNIPGHKDFAMFYIPILNENGTESYDKYTMKQPFAVNFQYEVSIITNKMDLLNEMNKMMLYEFNAITCYVSPNGHPMPLTLDNISDNSEYAIDDRKYYAQTYKIKLKGYIIRSEDFKVERIPSRLVLRYGDTRKERERSRKPKETVETFKNWDDTLYTPTMIEALSEPENGICELPTLDTAHDPNKDIPLVEEDFSNQCAYPSEDRYQYKKLNIIVHFDDCTSEIEFVMEDRLTLYEIESQNAYDFRLYINDELQDLQIETDILIGSKVRIKISKDDPYKEASLTLIGVDKRFSIDTEKNKELDIEIPTEETIKVG